MIFARTGFPALSLQELKDGFAIREREEKMRVRLAGNRPMLKRHNENLDSVMFAYFLPILLQTDATVTKTIVFPISRTRQASISILNPRL